MASLCRLCRKAVLAALLFQPVIAVPPSWKIWSVNISLPAGVKVQQINRSSDPGWGVDLNISARSVDANIWDDDGDAFFMLSGKGGFCKVSVGSDGLGPGADVQIFEQYGLDCGFASTPTGGPTDYQVTLAANPDASHASDCDVSACPDGACPDNIKSRCPESKIWRAHKPPPPQQRKPSLRQGSGSLTARIVLPQNMSISKVHRGSDPGYGVDLKIEGNVVDANVWDTDGDAFFVVRHGTAFCKVDVGSDGLGPGLKLEIFRQVGLDCAVTSSSGGPTNYDLVLSANDALYGSVDCDSTSQEHAKGPACTADKIWRAPKLHTPIMV